MADNDRTKSPIILLAVCLLLETVAFVCVTVIQFNWSRDLRTRFDESQAALYKLQRSCLDASVEHDLDLLLQTLRGKTEGEAEASEHVTRDKRQTNTALLQHMMLDMLKAEEKILLAHCQNNSKLCVPGPKGNMGLKGDQGLPGNQGPPGINGTDGTPGQRGLQGNTGPKGDQGIKGDPGSVGLTGPQGPMGSKGGPGSPGMKGDPGVRGVNGTKGEKGQKGVEGQTGQDGQPGQDGQKGEKGTSGVTGLKGEPGPQGPEGPPGVELQKDCICVKTPTISIVPNKATYHLGDQVKLSCVSTGDPAPTFTWSKVNSDSCGRTVPMPNLYIDPLQPSALGTWECEARNQYGTVKKQFTITANDTDPLNCNFEKGDTCLWRNDIADQSQWTLQSGDTPTTGTGPDFDHTLGNLTGHYVYLESSIGSPGDKANLLSPEISPAQESCLSFWYNMHDLHGQNMGTLSLLTKDCNDSMTSLIRLSGDQGMAWQHATITVPAQPSAHSFVLQAVRGSGVLSDIAIDDIEYYAGKCKTSLQLPGPHNVSVTVNTGSRLVLPCQGTGTPPPTISWSKVGGCGAYDNYTGSQLVISDATSGNAGTYVCHLTNGPGSSITKTFHVTVNGTGFTDKCDFESSPTLCKYTQEKSDTLDWIVQKGTTPSVDTGPTNDHTSGTTSGAFLFIEASSPSQQGDSAILRSHLMPANQSACFSFFYNMYGVDTGHLRVYVEDSCTHNRQYLFVRSGDQGTSWQQADVSIPNNQVPRDYFILVEADVGPSYHSDIAIDDLHIKDGACVVQSSGKRHVEMASDYNCDFEVGYCTWTQSHTDTFDWIRQTGSTQSPGTGPIGDHTTGNGAYIYIEATNQSPGDKADLVSKLLPAGHEFCLQFALNMYGSEMGSVNVIIKPQTNTEFLLNHFAQATSTSRWVVKKVNIPAQQHAFNIIIQGVRGSGFESDAAVDDITIHQGAC